MSLRIKKILMVLLLSLFTLPALAEKTILIVGDSLSAGYGLELQQGWVYLLKQRIAAEHLPYTVVNASISGDTTSNGLARLPAALNQSHPAITIIELGGNDGLRGLNLAVIKNNLAKMIALIKQANSAILLMGVRMPPNYGPLYTQQFEQMYSDLGKENAVAVIPDFLQTIDSDASSFQPDNIHPVARAQPMILNTVWTKLNTLLH